MRTRATQFLSTLRSGLRALSGAASLLLTLHIAAPPAAAQAPGVVDTLNANIVGEYVRTTAVQPDGKILLAGKFSSVLGQPRGNIARLNPDGSLDTTFDVVTNDWVYAVLVQPDGKIVIGGHFTTIKPSGTAELSGRRYLARLNPDGSLDTGFNPSPDDDVICMALEPNGNIVLGGLFLSLKPPGAGAPIARMNLARVFSDGSLDPVLSYINMNLVYCLVVQDDGKIIVGGAFRDYIFRINADGTKDMAFAALPNGRVHCAALQPDGRVVVGGSFSAFGPPAALVTRNRIARLNTTGTLDTVFNPNANGFVDCLAVQTDRRIVIGGSFTTLQANGAATPTSRTYLARLNVDGSVDTSLSVKPDNDVTGIALQTDGAMLVGGYFLKSLPGGNRKFFMRIGNTAATQTLSTPAPSEILWERGGSSPEAEIVRFELSENGGATWAPLGFATRVPTTSNWQMTGVPALPASYLLRARAHTGGGNRGLSLVQSTLRVGQTAREAWNLQWFGSTASTGPAASDADPNGNGIPNLMEYALGGDPAGHTTGTSILPGVALAPDGVRLQFSFSRYPDRDDINLIAQAADDLDGPWEDFSSSVRGAAFTILTPGSGYEVTEFVAGSARAVVFTDKPGTAPARFVRVKVIQL